MMHNAAAFIAELVSKREVIPGTFHFVLKAPACPEFTPWPVCHDSGSERH